MTYEAPLTEREYREIRANVMERVRSSRFAVRSRVFAMAAAVVVLLAFLIPRPQHITSLSPTLSPRRGARVNAAAAPAPPTTVNRQPTTVVATHRQHRRRSHRHPETQLVRLDIQTADPDVRIIWFAR